MALCWSHRFRRITTYLFSLQRRSWGFRYKQHCSVSVLRSPWSSPWSQRLNVLEWCDELTDELVNCQPQIVSVDRSVRSGARVDCCCSSQGFVLVEETMHISTLLVRKDHDVRPPQFTDKRRKRERKVLLLQHLHAVKERSLSVVYQQRIYIANSPCRQAW